MLPELPYFGSIGALSVNTYIVSYKLRRQRKGHFVVDDGLKLDIYTDFEYCRRRIRLFFGDDDVFLKEIYCVAISIALFRISNTYDGTDIVNNQQFNKSRLRHVTQATFVKSLIDWKISLTGRDTRFLDQIHSELKQYTLSHPESMFHIWYFLPIFVGCKQIIIKRIDI